MIKCIRRSGNWYICSELETCYGRNVNISKFYSSTTLLLLVRLRVEKQILMQICWWYKKKLCSPFTLLALRDCKKHCSVNQLNAAIFFFFLTGAQPKAGTGHKMQTVSFFQRYIVRDISLTQIYRWLIEILSVILKSTRHGGQSRKIIAFWGPLECTSLWAKN